MKYNKTEQTLRMTAWTNMREEAKVTFCWGEQDALTLEKFWDHCQEATKPNKTRSLIIDVPASEKDKYARVLIRNSKAQMWSFETKILNP